MNNDEQLVNEKEQKAEDIMDSLTSMIEMQKTIEGKLELLDTLGTIEPFINYPEEVSRIRKEVKIYD